jgi:hypothetical protein
MQSACLDCKDPSRGDFKPVNSRLRAIYVKAKKDPKKLEYMDLAMTPVTDDEDLEMFHTPSAPAFLAQEHRRQHAHEHQHEPAAVA